MFASLLKSTFPRAKSSSNVNLVMKLAPCVNSELTGQVRYGGGGGRPGGVPTFSWQERMKLRLTKKGEKRKEFLLK